MNKVQLILATSSKWKIERLKTAGIEGIIDPSTMPEKSEETDVYKYVKELATNKALNVAKRHKEGLVIGLDTVVYYKNKIVEKPKSLEEARHMLSVFSGDINSVITGICVINLKTGQKISATDETKVKFVNLPKYYIDYYMENQDGILDSSGYVSDKTLRCFIEKIDGTEDGVYGAPIYSIYKIISQMGYTLYDFIK